MRAEGSQRTLGQEGSSASASGLAAQLEKRRPSEAKGLEKGPQQVRNERQQQLLRAPSKQRQAFL